MVETLKKQWFVVLIALLLVLTVFYFVYDQNKDKLPGKSAGGKDVVFSVDSTNVTADELYTKLYDSMGVSAVYTYFERAVVDTAVKTTADLKSEAKLKADGIIKNFSDYYGADQYESYLLSAVKGTGYNSIAELSDYFLHDLKLKQLTKSYLNDNMDKYFPAFQAANSPRIVSHILVAMDDPAKPTAEEQARLTTVKTALAGGMDFATAAKTYSEDSVSATVNGSIGYADKNSKLDATFLATTMALKNGETSGWIISQYGYHLIKVTSTALEDLKADQGFYDALAASDATIISTVVWNQAKTLNVKFSDDATKTALLKYMGITE